MKSIITTVLLILSLNVNAWDHAVIMKPHEGAIYTVPIPLMPGIPNCVYINVTDCKDAAYEPDLPAIPPITSPLPEPPPVVSEIPTPIGTYGWSFYDPIDRTNWTITSDSQETSTTARTEQYVVENLIDEVAGTEWHSPWVEPVPHPHWVLIDMQTEHWVDSMIIEPRVYDPEKSWSTNSNPKDYKVEVSNDLNAWSGVATGTLDFTPVDAPQTIKFLVPNLVRYVRFTTLSSTADAPAVVFRDIEITESTQDLVITGGGV
jgi:hypothetical protein